MIALVVGFLLASPLGDIRVASRHGDTVSAARTDNFATDACDAIGFPVDSVAACRASCAWWSPAEKRCRDADVENLGSWDPRPAPHEWSSGYSTPNPKPWGEYPTEKTP